MEGTAGRAPGPRRRPLPRAGLVRRRRDHGVRRLADLVGVHPAGRGQDHRGRPGRGRGPAYGGGDGAVRGHRGQSNEHGLKTLVARAHAGEIIYFVAMCDRIAQILALQGDADPVDVRRSKAIAILANPAARAASARAARQHRAAPGRPRPQPGAGRRAGQRHAGSTRPTPAALRRSRACDPDQLRPRAVLYVRISEQALAPGRGGRRARAASGRSACTALARPARAPPGQRPPGARPARPGPGRRLRGARTAMREALRLARPSSVFPWSATGSGSPDFDHTRPYVPARGGRPARPDPDRQPRARWSGSATGSRPSAAAGSCDNPPRRLPLAHPARLLVPGRHRRHPPARAGPRPVGLRPAHAPLGHGAPARRAAAQRLTAPRAA